MTYSPNNPVLPHHAETVRPLRASAEAVFDYLDDHTRLAAHMSRSSWMMAGARMTIDTDKAAGRAVGSVIRLRGRILGLHLSVDEVVTEHNLPARKVWHTSGKVRLLVVGPYEMGFEVTPLGNESTLRVFIDYALPETWPARWLSWLLGQVYACWCTDSMANDAMRHFQETLIP